MSRPGRAASGAHERGSGTVLMLAIVLVLLVVSAAAGVLVRAVAAGHRADTAADLAALSAAGRLGIPTIRDADPDVAADVAAACRSAGEVAAAHEVVLVSCIVHADGVVDVDVRVRLAVPFGPAFSISATARAGRAAADPVPVIPRMTADSPASRRTPLRWSV